MQHSCAVRFSNVCIHFYEVCGQVRLWDKAIDKGIEWNQDQSYGLPLVILCLKILRLQAKTISTPLTEKGPLSGTT